MRPDTPRCRYPADSRPTVPRVLRSGGVLPRLLSVLLASMFWTNWSLLTSAAPHPCLFELCPAKYPTCCECECRNDYCERETTCGLNYEQDKDWGKYNRCINNADNKRRGCLLDCRRPSGTCKHKPIK